MFGLLERGYSVSNRNEDRNGRFARHISEKPSDVRSIAEVIGADRLRAGSAGTAGAREQSTCDDCQPDDLCRRREVYI